MSDRPIGPQIRIRDLREALGVSVRDLVETRLAEQGVTGVHEDTIRNVELGHKPASKRLMTAWAKALGLNPLDVWQPPAKESATAQGAPLTRRPPARRAS